MAAPAIFLSLSAATRSASTTIGPLDVLTSRADGFISVNSVAGLMVASGATAQNQVDRHHIGFLEQLLFGHQLVCPLRLCGPTSGFDSRR